MGPARRMVTRLLTKLNNHFRYFYRRRIARDPVAIALHQWFRTRGDDTLRLLYPLTAESVVLDVGGYQGDWAGRIVDRYDPYVFIFEPVPEFFSSIRERFVRNSKVRVFNFGLADRDSQEEISLLQDGTSLYRQGDHRVLVAVRDIDSFLREEGIEAIDLIKINIEGDEYRLLPRMIEKHIVTRCGDIQVQFHADYPDAARRREHIRQRLSETHSLTYDYPMVWENWRRK